MPHRTRIASCNETSHIKEVQTRPLPATLVSEGWLKDCIGIRPMKRMDPVIVSVITVFSACVPRAEAPPRISPAQPQCDFINFHHDESINVEGPGHCTTDCECDGMRACTESVCTGVARPTGTDQCHKPDYRWNEDWNGGGSGLCANDCQCNGTRRCRGGHCQDEDAPFRAKLG